LHGHRACKHREVEAAAGLIFEKFYAPPAGLIRIHDQVDLTLVGDEAAAATSSNDQGLPAMTCSVSRFGNSPGFATVPGSSTSSSDSASFAHAFQASQLALN
jgi:hypothetical protein